MQSSRARRGDPGCIQPKIDDAGGRAAQTKDQFAKVSIIRKQDVLLVLDEPQHRSEQITRNVLLPVLQ